MVTRLSCALLLTLAAPAAWADRHCNPAIDSYFAARHLLQAEAADCPVTLAEARSRLTEGQASARICGCAPLAEALAALEAAAADESTACGARSAEVLEAGPGIEALLAACY